MTRSLFFFTCLLVAESAFAAPPKDVTDLKIRYESAVEKAVQPITDIYKQELMKLLQKYKDANDIDGIAAVTEELTQSGLTADIRQFGVVAAPQVLDIDKLFVGKSWYSTANADYHFNKDGSGTRLYTSIKTPFTWRRIDDGIVEVSGRITLESPVTTWYFKFDNRKTALFGTNKDSIVDPLRAEK